MVPDLFFYQLVLVALVWLCVMLQWAWPSDPAAACPTTLEPTPPPPKRHREPTPFAGLIHKPHCAACEQVAQAPEAPPPPAPPLITSRRGRPRQVDTAQHFCPNATCDSRGWVDWGNISANGLPTICQPEFVKFFAPSALPVHDESGLHHSTYDDAA